MRRWIRRPHRAWQTAFAIAAIAASVALPVVLLSVGGGVYDHEIAALQASGFAITVSAPGLHGITDAHARAQAIERLAGVGSAAPILSVPIDAFRTGGGAVPTLSEGVIPGSFAQTLSPEERGLFPLPLPLGDPTDTIHYANGTYAGPSSQDVLLSGPFATVLGVHVGSTVRLAPTANGTFAESFTVTGEVGTIATLFGPTAAYAVVLPLSDLQVLTGYARANGTTGPLVDAADTIEVSLAGSGAANPSTVDRVAGEIAALYPYYGVSTLNSESQQLAQASAVLDGFYLALSSIGLTVGLVFLALILVRRVETERREIGIERAIGVPGRSIAASMGLQALTLAGVGTAGGLLGGWAIIGWLARFGSPDVREAVGLAVFNPLELALLVLSVLGLAALASVAATRSALRLSIVEALR